MREESRTSFPSVLAEKQGVTKATMTGLLDGLEQSGYIRRAPMARDGRCSAVALTHKGRRLLDEILPAYFRQVNEWMSVLPPEDLRLLRDMLERVLGDLPDRSPSPRMWSVERRTR